MSVPQPKVTAPIRKRRRTISPWDPVYTTLAAELNRRHRLEVLMEKWRDGAAIVKLQAELEETRVAESTSNVGRMFALYDWMDEDKVKYVAEEFWRWGARHFMRTRIGVLMDTRAEWLLTDEDEDLYWSGCRLALLSWKHEIPPEEAVDHPEWEM